MKTNYILACIISLGAYTTTFGQNFSSSSSNDINQQEFSVSAKADKDEVETDDININLGKTMMDEAYENAQASFKNYGQCSLILNNVRDREIKATRNKYKIITSERDEILEVKNKKNGAEKIIYLSDVEELKYKKNNNGEVHYVYKFIDGCEKVIIRKQKNGIVTASKNSYERLDELKSKAESRINKGASSCSM